MDNLNDYITERIRIDNVKTSIDLELGRWYEIPERISWDIHAGSTLITIRLSYWNVGVLKNTNSNVITMLFWSPESDIILAVNHKFLFDLHNRIIWTAARVRDEYDTKNPDFFKVVSKRFPTAFDNSVDTISMPEVTIAKPVNDIVDKFKNKHY